MAGAAYLIGILFDRFANTLLSGIEQRHRLDFAWNPRPPIDDKDPFAEDRNIAALGIDAATGDWLAYLRSRVRLSRALATFLPALIVAVALRLEHDPYFSRIILVLLSADYLAGYAALYLNWFEELPKTNEQSGQHHKHAGDKAGSCSCRAWWHDPAIVVLAVPFLVPIALALSGDDNHDAAFALVTVSGIALTWVAMLTWLTIRKTLMNFLYSCDQERQRSK